MMMKASRIRLRFLAFSALLVTATLAFIGCPADRRPEEPDQSMMTVHDSIFHPPQFPPGRTLDTVIALDFDGRGGEEYIVTSRSSDGDSLPGSPRADLIQAFSYDSAAHLFRAILVDSITGAQSIVLRDLTGDGVPEIVVQTDGGGNDPVATRGLAIYSGHGGTIRPIFESFEGDPQLTTMREVAGPAILMHDLYWPSIIPHVSARPYVSDLFGIKNGAFASVRTEHPRIFLDEAQRYLQEYRRVRDSVLRDTATFDASDDEEKIVLASPAALAMISLRLAQAQASLRSFWDSEREFLARRLPDAYMDDLSTIYSGAHAPGDSSAANAQRMPGLGN